ncbi:hypothetical protein [Actinoplanes sp. NPDC051494]|uniref:hypothetical protein n=1 Tax=Actinoplanes sp. NPDC051494 TaxID=3363907 RepID=UPI0037A3FCBE
MAVLLAAPVIEIDDFVSWECFADWWPRLDDQVLTPLLAGRDATYQVRDWTDWYGSTLGGWETRHWAPTVILEGATCTRRETIGRLAYTIWVEAPAEMRLARGMARDTRFPGKEAGGNAGCARRTVSSARTEPAVCAPGDENAYDSYLSPARKSTNTAGTLIDS